MATSEITESKNSSVEQAIADLLMSVAAEEAALANLMNATAGTIEALARAISDPEPNFQNKNISVLCKSINNTLETIAMKEWILSKKLNNVFEAMANYNKSSKKKI